ncbi:LysR substrate-binding domain-containing protein [Marinomonas transparens]|uniref:LysR family transcriptional regulator n=1 Tax=Marinomonas transparens TaxID=2795388 RepID=A0A934JUR0_9GAMM|nr:LysR substrate-binding domain-containing protein [Marinomonas transparens]MBJ7537649.1 LysR family transcriptional regulator [Marinomonas transparens]
MLTFRMIEAFRAVIINGSISEAANYMCISQPAVSRLIKDLEDQIGFKLFDRRHGRLFANDDGLAFYEEVLRSYIGLNRIEKTAEYIRKREIGELKIASLSTAGLNVMPQAIAQFLQLYPGIKIRTQTLNSSIIIKQLTSSQIDIGFVESSHSGVSLQKGPEYHLDSVCILPPGHRLATETIIKPEHLMNEPFISLGINSKYRFKIDTIFETAEIKRVLQIEAPESKMIGSLVLEGCGVSIVDPMTAATLNKQGLIVKPFSPTVPFSFKALSSSQSSRNTLVNAFYEVFSKVLSEKIKLIK